MYFAKSILKKTPGLKFYKLLGTGAGAGFSLFPDFSTYSILCVWDDSKSANDFINNSEHSIKISKIDENVYQYFSKNTKFLILDKKNSIKNLIWQNLQKIYWLLALGKE